jgi:hypothetical protein
MCDVIGAIMGAVISVVALMRIVHGVGTISRNVRANLKTHRSKARNQTNYTILYAENIHTERKNAS